MFQTKGGNSEHLEMLKRKGISACARIANQMPLNKMSLLSLERLFRAVVIPSCTYGLSAISNQLCEDNYDFLDVVQGRLVKLWFEVSKFASTSSLVNAVDVMIRHIAGLQISSPLESRRLDMLFCVVLGTGVD